MGIAASLVDVTPGLQVKLGHPPAWPEPGDISVTSRGQRKAWVEEQPWAQMGQPCRDVGLSEGRSCQLRGSRAGMGPGDGTPCQEWPGGIGRPPETPLGLLWGGTRGSHHSQLLTQGQV